VVVIFGYMYVNGMRGPSLTSLVLSVSVGKKRRNGDTHKLIGSVMAVDTLHNVRDGLIMLQDYSEVIKMDGGDCEPGGMFNLCRTMNAALQFEINAPAKNDEVN